MKTALLTVFFAIIFCLKVWAQPCWSDGVQLFSQYDVDNLKSISQGCSSVVGSVSIYGPNITNLDSLSWITSIGGNLWISPNAQLTNLQGLSNLTEVGGLVYISGNAALENLSGLNNLQAIGGDLILDDNAQLSDIDGLNSLTSIGADLNIGNNPLLLNVDGLSNLTTVGQTVNIGANSALVSLSGLDNLTSIGSDAYFAAMDNLANLNGMNNLETIGGTLWIGYCNQLSGISGFQNLDTIGGGLALIFNEALINFRGGGNPVSIGDSIIIIANPLLNEICPLRLPALIKSLSINGTSLNNLDFLQPVIAVERSLLIAFNESLSELSAFNLLETVGHDLWIEGNNLENINSFQQLKKVGGSLTIRQYNSLTSLAGLENLDSIGGTLELSCPYLHDLKALDSLKSVGGDLRLLGLDSLSSLKGLEGLASIGGTLEVSGAKLKLPNLTGLDSLKSVGKNILIQGNAIMTNLKGLENLESVGGRFTVSYNAVLSDCVVEGLCGQLEISPDSVFIEFNAPGCNSTAEVKAQCDLLPGQCLLNGITFYNQTEVDKFPINYPGCTEILGDVLIQGSDIANLDSLIVLTALGKQLGIESTNLPDLGGLDSLKSVGSNIFIQYNGALKRLQGLDRLDSVGGQFRVLSNSVLSDCVVEGLCHQLDISPDSVFIGNNSFGCTSPAEVKVECNLPPGQCLPYGITFNSQAAVDQFAINYPGCKEILGDVVITGSDIANLDSLIVLTALGKQLGIESTNLPDLGGLDSLKSVGSNIFIQYNGALKRLQGLDRLDSVGGQFSVLSNPVLSNCAVEGLCHQLDISPDSVFITNNGAGCTSPAEVKAMCDLQPGQCLPNGISFYNQDVVDQFTINYPGCKEILGNLGFYGPDISYLDSLSVLTSLGGALDISGTALANLNGLGNLTFIGGDFRMTSDSSIINLNALENVTHIGGGLYLSNLPMLTSLTGLENSTFPSGAFLTIENNAALASLDKIGVFTSVSGCSISNNDALPNLVGLENLTTIGGGLSIFYNPSLTSLNGLNNLSSIGLDLEIIENDALLNLTGLDNLTSIGNALVLVKMPLINNLTGLGKLSSIGGVLSGTLLIRENSTLTSLSGLDNLTAIEGSIDIMDNPVLTSLSGLQNISLQGFLVRIQNNDALHDLTGLENISIFDYLEIRENALLISLAGLESLDIVNNIELTNNPSLSDCAIFTICNQLLNNPTNIYITDNAPGCNTPAEVEVQCNSIPVLAEVRLDNNGNCQADAADAPAAGVQIRLEGMAQMLLKPTDNLGFTRFGYLESGPFSLHLPQFPAGYWTVCQEPILLDPGGSTDTIRTTFLLSPLAQCPELTVQLGMPSFFRGCLVTSDLEVSAQNTGAVTAQGLKVAVVLPPVLELLASAPQLDAQVGDTLYFDLGDVEPFDKAIIQLNVKTKCDTFLFGQTLCIETFATLDNACPTTLPAFSEIKLSATCVSDTLVRFTLKNIGDAPTQGLHMYTIIRNHAILQTQNFNLASQQSISIDLTADGATYRMEATKFDDGTLAATALENCGGLTPGFITAFWLDEGPLEYDFDCRQVIGAFDPNQKTAVPTGAGPYNTILANQPIQYTIDFQNTGTDTAYRVLLRDALPSGLDLETFRPAFSSHPCVWEIRGNTLEVLFSPIALPDSNVNEPASHGFFSFDIDQKPNLPDGTDFYNTASIIFDFNPPIVTNTVYHSIGKLTVTIDEPQRHADLWQLAGNPTRDEATFNALTFIAGEKRFGLYDASGRLVRTAIFSGQSFVFQRRGLPAGIYFFRITDEQGSWFTGRVVITD